MVSRILEQSQVNKYDKSERCHKQYSLKDNLIRFRINLDK